MTSNRQGIDTIVKEARDHIEDSWEHDRDNRRDAASDLAFLAGDQWPEIVRNERQASERPMLTLNRLPQFIRQVTNDIRQADLAIKVSPVGDYDDEVMSDIYNGLFRQIHYRSSAQHAYATAAEHQASCGIGWLRVERAYVDDNSFDQELLISPIHNPISVYCDPSSVKPDRSDAHRIAVLDHMPLSKFKRKYPKANPVSKDVPHDGENGTGSLFWSTSDTVVVAEYWRKVPVQKEIGLTQSGEVIDITDIPREIIQMLGIERSRKVDGHKVQMHIVSGEEILDGPYEHPGIHIPIVGVVGGEFPLEKRIYRYGITRFARDAQQLYNYYRTATAESLAMQPKSPWLMTTKMLGKFKGLWDTANRMNRPYLVYEPDERVPNGPKREDPPNMPSALMQEGALAAEDMKATTGIYDAGLGAKSNETSGRAIAARDRQGDVANYHFIDNLKRSMEHVGRICLDMIPKVYDNQRVIRLMGDDDEEKPVMINQVIYAHDGEPVVLNDLSKAKFDIRVKIGPSYTTQRMETQENLLELTRANPQIATIGADILIKTFDFDGSDELAERFKRTLPPEILHSPEELAEQQQQMPQQEPDELEQTALITDLQERLSKARKSSAEADRAELENVQFAQGGYDPGLGAG